MSRLTGTIAIGVGLEHCLAVGKDGGVWAWGGNKYGQLGEGTFQSRQTPVPVGALSGVTAITGGLYHSLAVTREGIVWAWGWNQYGQLGGAQTVSLSPVRVIAPSSGN